MPRNNDVYSPPSGTGGTPQTPISSTMFNAYVADITADLNAARPIVAGGTGATTAKGALENLGAGVSSLTTATTPLDGTELLHIVQGGNSRKATASEILRPNAASLAGLTLAAGDILYATGAGALANLGKGSAGQFLRQNAALTAPEWASGEEWISGSALENAANVAWTDLGDFRALHLRGFVRPATDGVNFFLRSSTNNGSSYDSGATDYSVMRMSQQATAVGGATTTAAFIPLNVGISIGNSGGEGLMFDVQIEQFNQGTYMWVQGTNIAIDADGSGFQEKIGGWRTSETERNALAVGFTSGNISYGWVRLTGWRG